MTISFAPLAAVALTGEAFVGLAFSGLASGTPITNEAGVGAGRLALRGYALGVAGGYVAPVIPPSAAGGLGLQGNAIGYYNDFGQARRVPLAVGGLAFGSGVTGAIGAFRMRGVANEGAPVQQYGFVVEESPEVVAYSDFEFEYGYDALAINDAAESSLTLVLRSLLAVAEAPASRLDALTAAADQLALDDALYAVLFELLNEGFTLDDTVTLEFAQVARVVSTLLLSGQVNTVSDAVTVLASALAVGEALLDLAMTQEGDTLVIGDVESLTATYMEALSDALAVADGLVVTSTGMALVSDAVVFDDAAATEAEFIAALHDALALSVHLTLDNGQYVAWTINAGSGGVSTFDNYRFNSYAQVGGVYYGASPDGLFRLDGDTDDGDIIAARLRLGMDQMGSRLEKSFSEVYVGYTGTGEMLLRVIITDDGSGQKIAGEYLMRPRPAAGRRESRFEPGKGLKAVYFDFEIENLRGADFDLSAVDFQPMFSNRRTRG